MLLMSKRMTQVIIIAVTMDLDVIIVVECTIILYIKKKGNLYVSIF